MEKINFRCDCGAALQAPLDAGGRKGGCHHCGQQVSVPLLAEVVDFGRSDLVSSNASSGWRHQVSVSLAICNVCHSEIDPTDAVETCSQCSLQYHAECWQVNLGCSAYGCSNVNLLKRGPDIRISEPTLPPNYFPPVTNRPAVPQNSEIPWDFLLLAMSALCLLMSLCSYGVFSLGSSIACLLYFTTSNTRNITVALISALALSVLGLVVGLTTSYFLWR